MDIPPYISRPSAQASQISPVVARHQFKGITAARGLAALLVFVSHTSALENTTLGYYFDPGKLGVVVFFFISGYLIIPSLLAKQDAYTFWVGRIFRLYPLYWISVFLAITIAESPTPVSQALANLTMAQQFLGFDNVLSVYWTLTIELAFYLFITILFFLYLPGLDKKINYTFLVLGILALAVGVARWQTQLKLPVALFLGIFVMFFGAIIRTWRSRAPNNAYAYYAYYLTLIIAICATAYSFETQYSENPYRYAVSYILGLCLFLLATKVPDRIVPAWLVLLGEISFGVYLFHPVFLDLGERWANESALGISAGLFGTLAISLILYLAVERPFIALGRRMSKSGTSA